MDVVAVRGLDGHRERTWTYSDLLPQDLPGLRTMDTIHDFCQARL